MCSVSRREFCQKSAVFAGAFAAAPSFAKKRVAPNDRLNIAAIGTGNRAARNITQCARENNIVALADVDGKFLETAGKIHESARRYVDFRVLLEKENKIDAVIVATPDHTHAPAAAMALRLGKHVYCEKPLTHTVYEARTLAKLAAKKKLVTQMGTQIHAGDNYRRVVEMVQSGTIGKIKEVHVWVGVNYDGARLKEARKPAHVNWDLWLGPTRERSYVEGIINRKQETLAPYHWRWFWDFGTGGLGDFGCHYMDLVHWALKLKHPVSISAGGPKPHADGANGGLVVKYKYPARGDMPPVELTWYDGGKKPAILKTLKDGSGKPINWGSGQLFVGEDGMILSNYSNRKLLSSSGKPPQPYIAKSIGHHNEWLQAIRTGGKTTCNFDYAGALTEAVLLGVVSYRSGESLQWDAANLKVTNSKKAQQMIHKEYRKGWSL